MTRTPTFARTRSAMRQLPLIATLALGLASAASAQTTDGEVRKIDRAQNKLTLRHGEIKNLDMMPMTMVFTVADAKLLDGLSVGSKVKFDAEKINGVFTVVRLVPVPVPPAP